MNIRHYLPFRRLSPLEAAAKQLAETKLSLLETSSSREYYEGIERVLEMRQARLEQYLRENTAEGGQP